MQPNRSNLSRRDFLATTAASVAAAGMMGAGCMEQSKQTAKATKTLAMCGLDCAACPAFIAYRTNDQALRAKTAAEWSKAFKVELSPRTSTAWAARRPKGCSSATVASARSARRPGAPGEELCPVP